MVFSGNEAGSPQAEKLFLQRLKQIVPESVTPILVTDAGYRAPWFRAVTTLENGASGKWCQGQLPRG